MTTFYKCKSDNFLFLKNLKEKNHKVKKRRKKNIVKILYKNNSCLILHEKVKEKKIKFLTIFLMKSLNQKVHICCF